MKPDDVYNVFGKLTPPPPPSPPPPLLNEAGKKNWVLPVLIIVTIIGVGGYLLYKYSQRKEQEKEIERKN